MQCIAPTDDITFCTRTMKSQHTKNPGMRDGMGGRGYRAGQDASLSTSDSRKDTHVHRHRSSRPSAAGWPAGSTCRSCRRKCCPYSWSTCPSTEHTDEATDDTHSHLLLPACEWQRKTGVKRERRIRNMCHRLREGTCTSCYKISKQESSSSGMRYTLLILKF